MTRSPDFPDTPGKAVRIVCRAELVLTVNAPSGRLLSATPLCHDKYLSCPIQLSRNPPATPKTRSPSKTCFRNTKRAIRANQKMAHRQLEGTVVVVTADSVLIDIGFKSEGILPLAVLGGEAVKPGDKLPVSVQGSRSRGLLRHSRATRSRGPRTGPSLEQAFAEKATIVGTVTGVIKGGFSVDVGVRAFMPASRSGVRDAAEMEKLVGQEIRCRIIKLDATEEDVVVDRRALAEEEERGVKGAPLLRDQAKAKPCAALSAASPTTAPSSIWAAWMACCMSARLPGAASASPRTCSRVASRSKPGCSKSIPKSAAFRWA